MGLLHTIKVWQIKSFTKGACRAMLISFGAFEHQLDKGKIEARLYSDLAAKALSTRPGWKQINENTFQHSSGKELKIIAEDNLANVTLSVILIEMEEFIFNDEHPDEILKLFVSEFRRFFSVSNDFFKNHRLLDELTKRIIGVETIKKFKDDRYLDF